MVATYTRDGYDLLHVREEVDSRVERLASKVHDDLVLQGVGKQYLEDVFEAGELHCSMHQFDDLTVFHFLRAEYTGLFVSLDSSADVPLCTFVETCEQFL